MLGGGIEDKEDLEDAIMREVREEAGYRVNIKKPVGVIIEYAEKVGIIQVSYCFICMPAGKYGKAKFTRSEKKWEMELRWARDFDEAIKLLKHLKSDSYEAKSMIKRDALFLRKAKEIMGKGSR